MFTLFVPVPPHAPPLSLSPSASSSSSSSSSLTSTFTSTQPTRTPRRITAPRCHLRPQPPHTDSDSPNNDNETSSSPALAAARRRAVDALRADLLRQYDAPTAIDWTLYDRDVTFDDPMTKLDGRLKYQGMIFSIALVVRTLFRNGTAQFRLPECALTPDGTKIRTLFETSGVTRWGAAVRISGEDFFWFGDDNARIVRHESRWDQSADEIVDTFLGRHGSGGGGGGGGEG